MARCWGVARGASKGEKTMPRQKDLKRLVRARMQKTGEAYTTARTQLLKKPRAKKVAAADAPVAATTVAATTAVDPQDFAAIAGMSNEIIEEKTGCTWERWVKSLDYHGAATMSHSEIAKLVRNTYKTPSWWTQTVAVGYERIKGLRVRGQQRNGTYVATKSRTVNVPVTTLFDAWMDPNVRGLWLTDAVVRVRTATAPKSIRLEWTDGSIIAVGFTPKGKTKSAVALEHAKLPDREAANTVKQYWAERLDALNQLLTEQ